MSSRVAPCYAVGLRGGILKDTTIEAMPTDLIGRYKPVDFEDLEAVSREAHLWAAADLGLGRCDACPRAT